MKTTSHESGQALVLIVFAIVGLVGLTGLAVDGGLAYSDRRNAQNAADTAALGAALAHTRGRDVVSTAMAAALRGGYNDDNVTNTVTVTVDDLPSGDCPFMAIGKDITVQITSHVKTSFAPVVGVRTVTNTVRATSRACDPYIGPMFPGDAIIALAHSGIGFDAAGTPDWSIVGGGIFSNSSGDPSARCKGAAGVTTPSLTTVGDPLMRCSGTIGTTTPGATQLDYSDYSDLLPRIPACDGAATRIGPFWIAQPGADGSRVTFNGGDMRFGQGLFCVTNSPGPYHGQITGTGVTFYLMPSNFTIDFNGGGSLTATAPLPGTSEYAGVLMFSAPQLVNGELIQTQSIDLRGNGTGDVTGSIIVPSADVTMFGNSNSSGYHTQVIAYHVDTGGNANININYQADLAYQTFHQAWLTLLR
ncbi:MAG: Tad domain-containing protein [Rudaea sp.]